MEFYGYRKCSTCRQAHQFLLNQGLQVEFQDFVIQPPTSEQLSEWVKNRGEGIAPFINTKGTVYREKRLKDAQLTELEWIKMLSEDGKLLKRPIVLNENEVVIGFDKEAYVQLAAKKHPSS